jgi:ectoine hydroxylase
MQITKEQVRFFEEQGYVLLPECFTRREVAALRREVPAIFAEDSLRRVVEKDGSFVRSVYGSHMSNETLGLLARHPRLVRPAMQMLGGEVYVYQFKVNAKASFGGDVWEWHQDYIFWMKEDGLPGPQVINAVVFLDEVNEFNGPLYLIPGSHAEGVFDVAAGGLPGGASSPYGSSPAWISNLTADLKYSLDKETVARLVRQHGLVAPKGNAGSVLFFHSNVVHGSPNNISPFDRTVVLVSFSRTDNVPAPLKNPRPDFLVSRNYEAIEPVADGALLSHSAPEGR